MSHYLLLSRNSRHFEFVKNHCKKNICSVNNFCTFLINLLLENSCLNLQKQEMQSKRGIEDLKIFSFVFAIDFLSKYYLFYENWRNHHVLFLLSLFCFFTKNDHFYLPLCMLSGFDSNSLGACLELFTLFPSPNAEKQMQCYLTEHLTLAGGSMSRTCPWTFWGAGSAATWGSAPGLTVFMSNTPHSPNLDSRIYTLCQPIPSIFFTRYVGKNVRFLMAGVYS